MGKQKIIQLIGSLGTGGAEALVKDYAIHFSDNVDCTVVVLNKSKTPSANEIQLREQGVKIINLADFVPFKENLLQRAMAKYKRSQILKDYLKKEHVEVIHSHLPVNLYVYWATKGIDNIKLFHTVHNEPKRILGKGRHLDALCVKKLVKTKGMRLIALHQDMAKELNGMFGVDNTVVVNNGIALDRFDKSLYTNQRQEILNELDFQEGDFVIGHVGRFTEQKNHAFLIDIFVALTRIKPQAKLLLIGSGELKAGMMDKVDALGLSKRVVMLENRRDIPELMSVMDIFLFPSYWEGLSVTLVEAQAMGLKCVVSQNVNAATHLSNQFIPLSLQEPVSTWVDMLVDETVQSEPVGNLSDFNIKNMVKKLENIYQS